MPDHDVIVIGAGWAGLSAAVRLTEQGHRPVLLDAAPQPGGRARGLTIELAGLRCQVDNGQHLIIGAYTETLALIARVAAPSGPAIRRAAMRLDAVDGMRIHPSSAPPPFDLLGGLLRAQGLSGRERWALTRALAGLRWHGWHVPARQTVAEWLVEFRQPSSLVDRFWLPLCIATMNTPPEAACAQTFANVLRDSLGASAEACEFVLPTRTLDEVLPQPACDWLLARGATLMLRQTVRALRRDPASGLWHLEREPAADAAQAAAHIAANTAAGGGLRARHVILALPPANALRVLSAGGHGEPAQRIARLGEFDHEPIVTVYMAWPADVRLPAWIMLSEQPATRYFGQWLFDRGEQQAMRIGAVVVSARGRAWLAQDDAEERVLTIARQVSTQLELPMPLDARAIVDKRATFRCTPDRPRLHVDALAGALPGLWLAGDHLWPDYPATLEAAVRSGRLAASVCAAALRRHASLRDDQRSTAEPVDGPR